MDGSNINIVRRVKPHQIKRLPVGTIVKLTDLALGVTTNYQVIQYGREKRLQSLERSNVFLRIRDIPGIGFFVEG